MPTPPPFLSPKKKSWLISRNTEAVVPRCRTQLRVIGSASSLRGPFHTLHSRRAATFPLLPGSPRTIVPSVPPASLVRRAGAFSRPQLKASSSCSRERGAQLNFSPPSFPADLLRCIPNPPTLVMQVPFATLRFCFERACSAFEVGPLPTHFFLSASTIPCSLTPLLFRPPPKRNMQVVSRSRTSCPRALPALRNDEVM